MNVSKTGVQETIARKISTGSADVKKRSGRLRKTTTRIDHMIKRLATAEPTCLSKFIQSQLPSEVLISGATIRRRLASDLNRRSYRPSKKLLLSSKNIKIE